MEEFSKNGRKLRPRKTAAAPVHGSSGEPAFSTADHHFDSESPRDSSFPRQEHGFHKSYGEGKPRHSDHKPYGGHSYGSFSKPSFGEHSKPYGEHKSSYGDRPSYGEHKSFGDRPSYGEHKSFGPRKPYGEAMGGPDKRGFRKPMKKKPAGPRPAGVWSEASKEGIAKMISRKPVINDATYSEADTFKVPFSEEVRLNKFIANSGVCSRREADTLIQAGVVTVNGEVVTELGTKVNVLKDEIKFNGERLKGEEKVYIIMNKPKGYVTTTSDPHAEKTVMELLKHCNYRVFPVGRLDKATTGVLMFTNDGEIAERLTHPSYDKKKIYQVLLNKPLTDEDYDKILKGVELSDGFVAADELEFIEQEDHRKVGIEIHSGKNRIVRRIFDSLGYEVKALDRVYFAGLTKKGLKKGGWRRLTDAEVNILKMGAYV